MMKALNEKINNLQVNYICLFGDYEKISVNRILL